jgi:hypothetical protein
LLLLLHIVSRTRTPQRLPQGYAYVDGEDAALLEAAQVAVTDAYAMIDGEEVPRDASALESVGIDGASSALTDGDELPNALPGEANADRIVYNTMGGDDDNARRASAHQQSSGRRTSDGALLTRNSIGYTIVNKLDSSDPDPYSMVGTSASIGVDAEGTYVRCFSWIRWSVVALGDVLACTAKPRVLWR